MKMHTLQHCAADIFQTRCKIVIRIEMEELVSCTGRHRERHIPGFRCTDSETAVLNGRIIRIAVSAPSPVVKKREIEVIPGG